MSETELVRGSIVQLPEAGLAPPADVARCSRTRFASNGLGGRHAAS